MVSNLVYECVIDVISFLGNSTWPAGKKLQLKREYHGFEDAITRYFANIAYISWSLYSILLFQVVIRLALTFHF